METNRQKKIAGVLQRDLADVLQSALREAGTQGIIISVTQAKVTTDLSQAKAYLSIFPSDKAETVIAEINKLKYQIKHQIALKTKNQLRRMPNLEFFNDDSLDYIAGIEDAVKGKENLIENRDLLDKRKKAGN